MPASKRLGPHSTSEAQIRAAGESGCTGFAFGCLEATMNVIGVLLLQDCTVGYVLIACCSQPVWSQSTGCMATKLCGSTTCNEIN